MLSMSYAQLAVAVDSHVQGWDLRQAKASYRISSADRAAVLDISYNPNRPWFLATSGEDGAVKIWDFRKTSEACEAAAAAAIASKAGSNGLNGAGGAGSVEDDGTREGDETMYDMEDEGGEEGGPQVDKRGTFSLLREMEQSAAVAVEAMKAKAPFVPTPSKCLRGHAFGYVKVVAGGWVCVLVWCGRTEIA